jgi:catalase (peroxidase I)
MTPEQREVVLSTVPEHVSLQHARRMLWHRIGMCGNEGSAADVLDLHSGHESLYFGDPA